MTLSRLAFPTVLLVALGLAGSGLSLGLRPEQLALPLTLLVLLAVAIVERVIPFERTPVVQGERRADVLAALTTAGLDAVLQALTVALGVAVARVAGRPTGSPLSANLVLEFVVALLAIEFCRYWGHRWMHSPRWWRFHAMHHAVGRVYLLNFLRFHPLNFVFMHVLAALPVLALGIGPEAMLLYGVFLVTCTAFQHANAALEHGWLNGVFSTNSLHRFHHSAALHESNANYGASLIVWDRLFGTYQRRSEPAPHAYGLHESPGYPRHRFWRELVEPFRGSRRSRS